MSTIIGTSTITDSTGATPGAAFTLDEHCAGVRFKVA